MGSFDVFTPLSDGTIVRQSYPVVWVHDDGRTITVYSDYKEREGFLDDDTWRTLYRSSVPALVDEEWYAAPGPDWRRA